MPRLVLSLLVLLLSVPAFAERDKQFSVGLYGLAGKVSAKGNGKLSFTNAGSFPTLTSGEEIPLGVESSGSGGEFTLGYTFSPLFSWHAGVILVTSQEEENFTTSTSNTHRLEKTSTALFFTPFLWTAWLADFVYLQAGPAVFVESIKVTSDITTVNDFDTGSYGGGLILGGGVEFLFSEFIGLNAGLRILSGKTKSQEKTNNSGLASEYTGKLEERQFQAAMIRLGITLYF